MLIVKLLKLICGLYNLTLALPLVSRDAETLTVVSGGSTVIVSAVIQVKTIVIMYFLKKMLIIKLLKLICGMYNWILCEQYRNITI